MDLFTYNSRHQVVACKHCETCVSPSRTSLRRHLREKPHKMVGEVLEGYLEYAESLILRPLKDLRIEKALGRGTAPIKHLRVFSGYCRLACKDDNKCFLTTYLPRMQDHMAVHGKKAKQHKVELLWAKRLLQTYFIAKGRINYFVVVEEDVDLEIRVPTERVCSSIFPLTKQEEGLFTRLKKESTAVKGNFIGMRGNVEAFNSKTARVPWLERTGFPSHLVGLKDEEIRSSYQLPSPGAISVESRRLYLTQTCLVLLSEHVSLLF